MTIDVLLTGALAIVLVFLFIVGILLVLKVVKKLMVKVLLFLLNSLSGIILLLIVVYVFDVSIPINIITVVITAIFGVAGIGTLLLLHLSGMI